MQGYIKLKDACRFYPYDGLQNEQAFIILTPDNRQFKISALAKEILQKLDGKTDLEEIAQSLEAHSATMHVDELRHLVRTQYQPLGIFEGTYSDTAGRSRRAKIRKGSFPFLLHWDLIPQTFVARVSNRLRHLYSPAPIIAGVALILFTHYLVYFKYSTPEFLSNASFLYVLGLCLLSVLWHEFGHSSAVSKYGGTPGKIGFGLFILMPSFYADVSEIWRFRRKHRMIVDLGGVYFQELFFAAAAMAGVLTSAPEFFVVCHFIDLMVLLTLNPVFQFDGYWFLVDFLGLPNLYRLALSYIKHSIKKIFKGADEGPVLPPMPRHAYVIFFIYSILCNLFFAAIVWLSYRYLYSTFTRVHTVLPAIFDSMVYAFKTRDLLLFSTRLLTLFFVIAFPATALVGIFRYLALIVRYCVSKIRAPKLSPESLTAEATDFH